MTTVGLLGYYGCLLLWDVVDSTISLAFPIGFCLQLLLWVIFLDVCVSWSLFSDPYSTYRLELSSALGLRKSHTFERGHLLGVAGFYFVKQSFKGDVDTLGPARM
jgi:hypothetical protein